MKFRPNKRYTIIAIYAFLVIAASILFKEAIGNFQSIMNAGQAAMNFIQPVIYGFVLAFLLNPMLRLYDDRVLPSIPRLRMKATTRRTLAMVLTYLTLIAIITVFFRLVIPQLVISMESLGDIIPKYIQIFNVLINDLIVWLENFEIINAGTGLADIISTITNRITGSLVDIMDSVYSYVTGMIPHLFTAGARFTTGIVNLLLGFIISIYFLYDREKLFAQTRKITDALFTQRTSALLYDVAMDANRIFSGFITGKIIDSAIIGVICFVGMTILRMPFAVLISVIVGVTNIIPYFGPFIGAIPGVLIIFIVEPWKALWFIIFILLLQQFDGNILGPKILGESTGLSALWVIFAIMLFSGIFGILGMFIGVPLFALIYTMIKRVVAFLLRRKGMSENTRDYASDQNPLIK